MPVPLPTENQKPWYKKWWVWVIVAVVVIGGLGALGEKSEDTKADKEVVEVVEEEPQSEETAPEQEPQEEAPDQVGELLSIAQANLELHGFEVESVSDDGAGIWDKGNWVVLEQKQNGETVLLIVSRPEPETEAAGTSTSEEATTGGLTATYAQTACDIAADATFPYGVKMHWMVGKLAERYDPETDEWFFKVTATVTNEYGAKMKGVNVECYVTGTNDNPQITNFLFY